MGERWDWKGWSCVGHPSGFGYRDRAHAGDVLRARGPLWCPFGLSGVDVCMEQEHGCQHSCVSTPSSFYCECNPGYKLNVDGKTCSRKNSFPPFLSCHRGLVVTGLTEGS